MIPKKIGDGGSFIAKDSSSPGLKTILFDVATDLHDLRLSIMTLTAKLDLDATVTDTDYAAECDPEELLTEGEDETYDD